MGSTYADDRQRNRLQGMLLTVNGDDSIMETQLYGMGIPQAVSQRKARRRHADTPGNPAISWQPPHLLPLHERAAYPHAWAASGSYQHLPSVPYGYTEELNFDNYIDRYAYE